MDPKKITPSTDSVYEIEATISWIFLLLINQHVAGQFKCITGDGKITKYKKLCIKRYRLCNWMTMKMYHYTSDYIPYLWQLTPHKPSHFPAVRSLEMSVVNKGQQ